MNQRDSKTNGTHTSPDETSSEQAVGEGGSSRRAALGQALTVLSGGALTVLLPTETRAQLSTGETRLVLQDRGLAKRANELFAEVRRDKQTEREFIENPVGVLGAKLSPREFRGMSRPRLANANRVLYALLANDAFLGWLRSYQKELEGTRVVDKGKVTRDFASAMARYGDAAFFQGMLEEEAAQYVSPGDTHSHVALSVDSIVMRTSYLVWNKPGGEMLNPAEMRALTDLLAEKVVAKAKEMKAAGALEKQIVEIQ